MHSEVSYSQHIFSFCKDSNPVLSVKSGEIVKLSTMDCFANQLKKETDKLEGIDWDRVNPATGPIYVAGAEPQDALKATILNIEIGAMGIMATGENLGVLGKSLKGMHTKFIPLKDGFALFGNIKVPIAKMIGVIGVAPAGKAVNCGTPGSHGGNMDNKMICEGSEVYFPVNVQGALFSAGDVHAAMGDGEVGVSGVEAPAVITVKLDVIKGMRLKNPYLENKTHRSTIASHVDINTAIETAVSDMADILKYKFSMNLAEVSMLMSMAGNLEICQVVDPLKTVRFTFPKTFL